ncbi:MAG: hypothetical protein Q9190_004671, partial [Brigantiaea leucoxantha]
MAEDGTWDPADPDGDLILSFGADKDSKDLQVSSKVLSLASPVFAAMFTPHFKEGNALLEGRLPRILLPDDDPDAMRWISYCLHHRKDLDLEPPVTIWMHVAVLSDKYFCSNLIKPWAQMWMQNWRSGVYNTPNAPESELIVAYISYAFDDIIQFWHSTREIFRHCTAEYFPGNKTILDFSHIGYEILPPDFLDHLGIFQQRIYKELENSIDEIIDPYVRLYEPYEMYERDWAEVRRCNIQRELRGLWPPEQLQKHDLASICQKIEKVTSSSVFELEDHKLALPAFGNWKASDHKEQFQRIGRATQGQIDRGLCLQCVKAGRMSMEDNCRSEQYEWGSSSWAC